MAEGVGFEPTDTRGINGFQDRRHRPLSHPSAVKQYLIIYHIIFKIQVKKILIF